MSNYLALLSPLSIPRENSPFLGYGEAGDRFYRRTCRYAVWFKPIYNARIGVLDGRGPHSTPKMSNHEIASPVDEKRRSDSSHIETASSGLKHDGPDFGGDSSLPPPPNLSPEEEKRLWRKVDRRLMPILAIMYLMSFLDRGKEYTQLP